MNELDKALARMERVVSQINWRHVEASHYERDESYRLDSLAQVPMVGDNPENKPNVEFYAPTQVSVLAYPILYCMACATEHTCAYTNKINNTLGVCETNYHVVKPEAYEPSVRVQTAAEQSYTGTLTRASEDRK